jgi:hypothetical protein
MPVGSDRDLESLFNLHMGDAGQEPSEIDLASLFRGDEESVNDDAVRYVCVNLLIGE